MDHFTIGKSVKNILLVKCIDWRLGDTTEEYILRNQGEDIRKLQIYVARLPGACLDIVKPNHPSDRECALKYISRFLRIADPFPEEIYLCNHGGCTAYRLSHRFFDDSAEEKILQNDVLIAQRIVDRRFPTLKVIPLYEYVGEETTSGIIDLRCKPVLTTVNLVSAV